MRKNSKLKMLLLLTLCFTFLAACSSTPDTSSNAGSGEAPAGQASDQPIDLRFMAAPQSGSWYPLGVAITEELKKNMSNLRQVSIEPGGGISNVIAINNGQGQVGFSQAMPTVDGVAGNPPFNGKQENVQYVLSLFPHNVHIVVLKESGIKTIEDIKGKRINVGPKGLLNEDIAKRILGLYGLGYEDMKSVQNLTFADATEQMKDGRIDVMFWTVPAPYAVLTDLAQSKNMELISIPEDKIDQMIAQYPGLFKTSISKDAYKGLENDVVTIQSPLVVLANKDASEDLVYNVAKTIYEGLDQLKQVDRALEPVTPESLPVDIGVPMHPGAQKFFEEQGLLK